MASGGTEPNCGKTWDRAERRSVSRAEDGAAGGRQEGSWCWFGGLSMRLARGEDGRLKVERKSRSLRTAGVVTNFSLLRKTKKYRIRYPWRRYMGDTLGYGRRPLEDEVSSR